ncbi:MAG: hypothetical protein WC325_11575 [Candidatus Bathyarchaeia archaeon]
MVQIPAVRAQSEDSKITGTIFDDAVDTNGDGLYNYLLVGVQVNITEAGTYTVKIDSLFDSEYNPIKIAVQNKTHLNVGINIVYLNISGYEIYYAAANPAMLGIFGLYNSTDSQADSGYGVALSEEYTYTDFQVPLQNITLNQINRQITINEIGKITVFDKYTITNNEFKTLAIQLGCLTDAKDITVRDEMGKLGVSVNQTTKTMTVNLRGALQTGETTTLYALYKLPWDTYTSNENGQYALDYTFFEEFNTTITKLTVSITLPKGANYKTSTVTPLSVNKDELQQIINYQINNVHPTDNLNFALKFEYSIFWASLYPTLWAGVIAAAAAVILFLNSKSSHATVTQTTTVQPESLKSFADTYEEKIAIRQDLEALEERLQAGKVPRRQYKVRRKMLEGRLSAVSRNLSALSNTIRQAGSSYGSLVRQIEVAETNLDSAQRNMQHVQARYSRGEISKGAYQKLVDEYKTKIEEAESTIDGVLLRLRG